MKNVFHQTIELTPQLSFDFTEKAKVKNAKVLQVFIDFPDRSFTPLEVNDILKERDIKMLDTSVRRAVNYLWDEGRGEIIKVGSKMERYGLPNNLYKLKC